MLKGRIAFPNQFHVEPRKHARSKTAHMRAHTQQTLRPAEGTMPYCVGDTWGDVVFCGSAGIAGPFAPRGNHLVVVMGISDGRRERGSEAAADAQRPRRGRKWKTAAERRGTDVTYCSGKLTSSTRHAEKEVICL